LSGKKSDIFNELGLSEASQINLSSEPDGLINVGK
jgi:hypothetical protein